MFALEIAWDASANLPALVGPFESEAEAERWATLNVAGIGDSVAFVRPLGQPYMQPTRITRRVR